MNIHKNQSGFALLILVVILLSIVGVFGSNLIQGRAKTVLFEKMQHDEDVLQKAKQALLSYAVEYKVDNDVYEMGRLPCPDYKPTNSEGAQDGSCGDAKKNISGFLPWKTLGIEALKDSSGECLWYVVSGDYKDYPSVHMLNEDTNGLLKVQGEDGLYHADTADDRPIALIIAPGPALNGQDRTPTDSSFTNCRGKYGDENEYLESDGVITYSTDHADTVDTVWTYFYGNLENNVENNNYNDRIVWISKSEYWNAINAQGDLDVATTPPSLINELTQALAECITDYANNSQNDDHWLPWPAAIDLSDYREDSEYDDQYNPSSLMGRYPANVKRSNDHESGPHHPAPDDHLNSCLTPDQLKLWKNWKDHYFYVVSEGFEMVHGENDSNFEDRCSSDKCVTVDGSSDKYAGVVFYADSVVAPQIRSYPPDSDTKKEINNYLNTNGSNSNAHLYPSDSSYSGDPEKYFRDIGDLMYCIKVNSSSFSVTDCQ
jgi:hypothetical protein